MLAVYYIYVNDKNLATPSFLSNTRNLAPFTELRLLQYIAYTGKFKLNHSLALIQYLSATRKHPRSAYCTVLFWSYLQKTDFKLEPFYPAWTKSLAAFTEHWYEVETVLPGGAKQTSFEFNFDLKRCQFWTPKLQLCLETKSFAGRRNRSTVQIRYC